MPFILIKGGFKPAVEIPDGDSDRFQANNPALWKKLDGPLVRLDTSDKSKHIFQEPHLKGIEAIKTTTSKNELVPDTFFSSQPKWFLTALPIPRSEPMPRPRERPNGSHNNDSRPLISSIFA